MAHVFDPAKYAFSAFAVPTALTAVVALVLGLIALWRERASPVSVSFSLLTLSIGTWLAAFSWMYCAQEPLTALAWAKAAYLGVPFIPSAVFQFTVNVLQRSPRPRLLAQASWALSALFASTILGTDALIVGLHRYPWGYYPAYGWLSIPYLTFFFGMMIASLRCYWVEHRNVVRGTTHARRVSVFMIALGLMHIGSIDYLAKFGIPVYPFGYLPVLLFLMVAAWAIWRYRLLDITAAFAANQIVETMAEALLVLDLQGTVRVANRAACQLLDLQASGDTARSLVTGAGHGGLLTPGDLRAILEAGKVREYSVTCRDRRGQPLALSLSASVIRDPAGQPVALVCLAHDLTERKRVEAQQHALIAATAAAEVEKRRVQELEGAYEDIQVASEALRRSERQLTDFFESAPVGLCWVGPDGIILRTNRSQLQLLGYDRSECVGRHLCEFYADQDAGEDVLARLRRGGTLHNHEARLRCKDGSIRHVLVDANVLWEHGQFIHMRVFIRDITERTQAEQALQAAVKDLARSNRELEQFAYVASHDLREPLRKVASYTELLAQRYRERLAPEAEKYIAYVADGCVRMEALIRDLLAYSRIGERAMVLEPVDFNDVLRDVLTDLEVAIRSSGAAITAEALPTVTANRSQMRQVLQNLLGNALKFRGQAAPRIHVGAREEGGAWRFSVRDNGIGIAGEYAERIFVIFQRLHTRTEYPGTGIGLAICKKILERHGGRIWVESHPGRGSTFHFTLPLARREAEERPEGPFGGAAARPGLPAVVTEDELDRPVAERVDHNGKG